MDGTKPITGFPSNKPDTPTSGIIGKLLIATVVGAIFGLWVSRKALANQTAYFSPQVLAAYDGVAGLVSGVILVLLDIAKAGIDRAQSAGLSGKSWKALCAFSFFLIFLSIIAFCIGMLYLDSP